MKKLWARRDSSVAFLLVDVVVLIHTELDIHMMSRTRHLYCQLHTQQSKKQTPEKLTPSPDPVSLRGQAEQTKSAIDRRSSAKQDSNQSLIDVDRHVSPVKQPGSSPKHTE